MIELSLALIIGICITAFFCEYIDSTLGMGYGTTMTPILILLGFNPKDIVPAVLLSELITGLLGSFFHHREGNVNFKPKSTNISVIRSKLSSLGYLESFKRRVPLHLKVVLVLTSCSIISAVSAIFISRIIPKIWLKLYIGFLVCAIGIFILIFFKKEFKFS